MSSKNSGGIAQLVRATVLNLIKNMSGNERISNPLHELRYIGES